MSSLAVVVGEFFVVDAHAQEFFPEPFPCDAKQFRGLALVAAGFVQHIKDEFALHFLQVVVLRRWRFLPRGICPIPADERFRLEKVASDFIRHDTRGEIGKLHTVADRQRGGAFHFVIQFTYITGPAVLQKLPAHGGRERKPRPSHIGAMALKKKLCQQKDVISAISQGRNPDFRHIDAVIEIFPKVALADGFFQIGIGGGDELDVHAHGFGTAHAQDFALLQNPEQLGLIGPARRETTCPPKLPQ